MAPARALRVLSVRLLDNLGIVPPACVLRMGHVRNPGGSRQIGPVGSV